MRDGGISPEFAVSTAEVPTFTYTKLINVATEVEDRPRVDFVNTKPLPASIEQRLIENLRQAWEKFDVVLVSDQAETAAGGVVTNAVRAAIGELAADGKTVWVDSRVRAELFRNVVLKCNCDEAEAACQRAFGASNFEMLRQATQSRLLVVTHGQKGAMYVRPGGARFGRTRQVENPRRNRQWCRWPRSVV